jgi:glycosyltransferase involved in cell wall biosynthesis
MITVGYSTRQSNPDYINYIKKTCLYKDVEVIEVINEGDKSLSEVYNQIISVAKNDIIVLCHDDLEFDTKRWGEKILKIYDKNPDYGIIGVAGTTDLINGRWWTIKESMVGIVSHKQNGKKWTNYYSPDQDNKIKEVVVLDGLFFAINRKKIKSFFNEKFKGFHFYDIPFFLENYLKGVKIGVTTQIKLTHMSIGETNEQWEDNKKLFEDEYQKFLPIKLTNNKSFEEKLEIDIDKIGIGMVTYNAENRIKQSAFTIPKWIKNFVIVNDGTPYDKNSYPEHAFIIQHDTNKSVGIAKNTALKYLTDLNCEHIFLIEDDILIKDENVFKEYIKHSIISGIKHLNFALHGPANKKGSTSFTNLDDRKDVDGEPNPRMLLPYPEGITIALYPNCVGAFSYYHKSVIDKIGLFDPMFKNAWEHVEHTYQAIKNKFHPPFWYFADIQNSWNFLTDIPNSIQESTIARTPEWNQNFKVGTDYYRKKHGITPTETPLTPQQNVVDIIKYLYNNR